MEGVPKFEDSYQKTFESYKKHLHLSDEDVRKSILDVAAGTGGFVHYLRETLGNKDAYGVEISASKILPRDEGIIRADGFVLPFADEKFETVISKNYLPMFVENDQEMHEAIRELLRVTARGGKVISDIATPDEVKEFWEDYKENMPSYNQKTESHFRRRYEGSHKLLEFLEELQNEGLEIQRDGAIVRIKKS